MRAQLIQYVDLLFAGTKDSEDIRQEILQNTLDRYDDLIAEGKSPEAAYRLAILSIGDINEILTASASSHNSRPTVADRKVEAAAEKQSPRKKLFFAIAVSLYILCPVPLIIAAEVWNNGVLGLSLMFITIAVATAMIIMTSEKEKEEKEEPENELQKSIGKLVGTLGLIAYLVISFLTGAWFITWVIFPLMGAVKGLIKAIIDLKEATKS